MKSHGNGGRTLSERRNPYTCGLTGRSYSWVEVFERVEFLARALSKRTGWAPNAGTPWDKVGCVFSLNSVSSPLENIMITRIGQKLTKQGRLHPHRLRHPQTLRHCHTSECCVFSSRTGASAQVIRITDSHHLCSLARHSTAGGKESGHRQ